MIKEKFIKATNIFLQNKDQFKSSVLRPREISNFESFSLIVNDLPNNLLREANIVESKYVIKGSVGKGSISEVPWICVFDNNITASAQTGYYLVYLFDATMQGVYLSLNQGWTQYEKKFGVKEGKIKISNTVLRCQKYLRSIGNYDISKINLHSNLSLSKGYEFGNICSKYYSLNDFPEDLVLLNDLRNFIGLYTELKGMVGLDILNIDGALTEEEFQTFIQQGEKIDLPIGPINKKDKIIHSASFSWSRDSNNAFMAIQNANFTCENDLNHKTFISVKTGNQFVEAHHLIPIEFQDRYQYSIDVPENIISLCPNCHRAFHSSTNEVKDILIAKFIGKRKPLLLKRGIGVEDEQLLKFYHNIEP